MVQCTEGASCGPGAAPTSCDTSSVPPVSYAKACSTDSASCGRRPERAATSPACNAHHACACHSIAKSAVAGPHTLNIHAHICSPCIEILVVLLCPPPCLSLFPKPCEKASTSLSDCAVQFQHTPRHTCLLPEQGGQTQHRCDKTTWYGT